MKLQKKIIEKQATLGIIGLGHTGLSLAHDFSLEGFKVIGFDIDRSKIKSLIRKESYLSYLPLVHLLHLLEEKRFIPTSNSADLAEADVIILSVPTPLNKEGKPDLSCLKKAAETAGTHLKPGKLIVIQSTSFPGTTEEILLSLIEKTSHLKGGQDFFLGYVPEREDVGNPRSVLSHIPRICGGLTPMCTTLVKHLYEHITIQVYSCPSIKVAEAAKAFENTYRLINIAFVNEMKMAFEQMGVNIWDVIAASSTKPFGFTPFYPGPGIGGECIPVDPVYLAWRAEQFGTETSMIKTALTINDQLAFKLVQKMENTLKDLKGKRLLILGVAFKKDVGDTRESPALRIMPLLQKKGADVSYNDPYVSHLSDLNLSSIPLEETALSTFDCVLIVSDHSRYDWEWICEHSQCVIDTRNATRHLSSQLKKKVIL